MLFLCCSFFLVVDFFLYVYCFLVSNLVSPLFDGFDVLFNDGGLGDLSDWGKNVSGGLWESEAVGDSGGHSVGNGTGSEVSGDGGWDGNGSGVGNGYWGSGGCNNTVVGSVGVRVGKSSVAVVGILSRAGSNSTGKNNQFVHGAMCMD